MYCKSCGHKNEDSAKICIECGKEMNDTETIVFYSESSDELYDMDDDYETLETDYGRGNRGPNKVVTVIFSIILVICIGIVGAVGFYFVKGKNSSVMSESVENTDSVTSVEDNSSQATDNYGNVKPDNYCNGDTYYVDDDEGLFLRKGPDSDYEYEEILYSGEKVALRGNNDDDDDWYYVYVESMGKYGWINKNYLTETKPAAAKENGYITYNASFTRYVSADDGLYLREGPSTSSDEITLLEYKKSVEVIGYAKSDKSWYYVRSYINGSYWYGYCHKDYLS